MPWYGRSLSWFKEPNGCFRSTSHGGRHGSYPEIMRDGKRKTIARIILIRSNGDSKGIIARHTCDNKWCINPNHIIPGTVKDNSRDSVERGQAPRGEKIGNSKLKSEQILAIRDDPRPQRQIAKDYGVTQPNIGYIKRRESWTHL